VVEGCYIQGGDIKDGIGDSGYSLYGKNFEVENYSVCHEESGIVGMCN